MLDKARVKEKLLTECSYNNVAAESLSSQVIEMPASFQTLAEKWLDGVETDCSYEEFSVFGLMKDEGLSYLNALNVISCLTENPDETRKILSEGIM